MGRPPLPKTERRSVKVSFRVTAALHKAIAEAARRESKSIGKYISETLEGRIEGGK